MPLSGAADGDQGMVPWRGEHHGKGPATARAGGDRRSTVQRERGRRVIHDRPGAGVTFGVAEPVLPLVGEHADGDRLPRHDPAGQRPDGHRRRGVRRKRAAAPDRKQRPHRHTQHRSRGRAVTLMRSRAHRALPPGASPRAAQSVRDTSDRRARTSHVPISSAQVHPPAGTTQEPDFSHDDSPAGQFPGVPAVEVAGDLVARQRKSCTRRRTARPRAGPGRRG